MKTILIYPYFLDPRPPGDDAAAPPMGIYYVGAILKAHGYEVQIFNWYGAERGNPAPLRERLKAADPDIIGFSVLNANRWGALEIAALAKEIKPGVIIVLGGIGATCLWEFLLTHFKQIDYIIRGEGERSFLELVQCIQRQAWEELKPIPGLARRSGTGRILGNPPRPPERNLDDLPMPARYFSFQHLALSRGCASRCTFCGSPDFWQGKLRFHSPDYLITQIELLHQQGINFFFVSDDTFTASKPRVLAVCRGIIAKGLPIQWAAIARVDQVDGEMLSWMRRAGCIQISYGVESGDPQIRERLNKGVDDSRIERAFELTRGYGLLARAYFIYGSPGESDETIQASLDLIQRIKPLAAIFYILDIFPGTQLYQDFKARTGAGDEIWLQPMEDIMYFQTDPRLKPETIRRWGQRLRDGFHSRLPQFIEDLELVDDPELTTWHADFYSRLGLTLLSGDYAALETIPRKAETAALCFRRALTYQPNARAYLGLAILAQKEGRPGEAIQTAREGLSHFAGHPDLTLCLGVGYLAAGDAAAALACFEQFPQAPNSLSYRIVCHEALGQQAKADALRRLQSTPPAMDSPGS
ncbi:MAG: radical SAM protein [Desulfobacterales bacterium]